MTKKYWSFYLIIALLIFSGCKTAAPNSDTAVTNKIVNKPESTEWLYYYQTQCNDYPWGDTRSTDPSAPEQALADSIIEYYETQYDVTILAVDVMPPADNFISCQACGCPTGTVIKVKVNEADEATLLDLDFETTNLESDSEASTNTNTVIEVEPENSEDTTGTVESTNVTTETEVVNDDVVTKTPEDNDLQTRATQVQAALKDYYSEHSNYPLTLDDLNLDTNLDGITYTSIGTEPAQYYDLRLEYSTGPEILNP